mgnify:CR=1 FL=1
MLNTFLCTFYVKQHSLNITIPKEHSLEVLIIKKRVNSYVDLKDKLFGFPYAYEVT